MKQSDICQIQISAINKTRKLPHLLIKTSDSGNSHPFLIKSHFITTQQTTFNCHRYINQLNHLQSLSNTN